MNHYNYGGNPTSKIPAHHRSATVATFRSWRGLQSIIAKPPAGLPLQEQSILIFYRVASHNCKKTHLIVLFAHLHSKLTNFVYLSSAANHSIKIYSDLIPLKYA